MAKSGLPTRGNSSSVPEDTVGFTEPTDTDDSIIGFLETAESEQLGVRYPFASSLLFWLFPIL